MNFKLHKIITIPKAYIIYYYYQFYRLSFNITISKELSISKFKKNKPYILYDALFDNPLHWWKIVKFKNFYDKKYNSIGVISSRNSFFSKITVRVFKFNKIYKIIKKNTESIKIKKESLNIVSKINNKYDIINIKFPFNFPSYHLYDYILKKERLGTIDNKNYKILNQYIEETLMYLYELNNFFLKYNIKHTVVSHKIGLQASALSWMSIYHKIPVRMINHYNGHTSILKLNNKDDFLSPIDDCFNKYEVSNLNEEYKKVLENKGIEYLNKIRNGMEGEIQRFKAYKIKSFFKKKDDFLKSFGIKSSEKKIVVIMANAWPDFPNQYGESIYPDFLEWFLSTIEISKRNTNCIWLVKPHPAESEYGDRVIIKNILNFNNYNNIFFWPKNANGKDLMKFCECVVSARGTSTIEYSALGKVALTCFDSPFSDFDFSYHGNTKETYENLLLNIHNLASPDENQKKIANIFASSYLADLEIDGLPRFPFGDGSFRLFLKFNKYIKSNSQKLSNESALMYDFLEDEKYKKYNVYRIIKNLNNI